MKPFNKTRVNPTTFYKVGQELELEMLKPKPDKGSRPVCRTKEGVFATLLILPSEDRRFEYGSVWKCKVVSMRETAILVEPMQMVMTAVQYGEYQRAELIARFNAPRDPKPEKTKQAKAEYQYLRSDEKSDKALKVA
jgi:hypothetical protein